MSYTLNIIVFSIAFAFLLGGGILYFNSSITNVCGSSTADAINASSTITNQFNGFFSTTSGQAAALGAGAILLGTVFFPNPWLIFLAPTIVLYGYVNYVNNLLSQCNVGTNIPQFQTLQTIFALIMAMMMGMAIMSWFKGQEPI
jgi:hypothetical protein